MYKTLHPKFIIVCDTVHKKGEKPKFVYDIKLARVEFHKDLTASHSPSTKVRGGGWFLIPNLQTKRLFLYSRSIDYGQFNIDYAKKAIANTDGWFYQRFSDFEIYATLENNITSNPDIADYRLIHKPKNSSS